jgi:hypothetical protein
MQDVLARLVDLPLARVFLLAGIVFLLVAVMGRIEGKIEPGNAGRVGAAVTGVLLLVMGLAMYFLDGDQVRSALRDGAARTLVPRTSASAVRVDPPAPSITVVVGTYGRNCGAPRGNVTSALERTCNGRSKCNVAIDAEPAAGATPGCDRDYAAEWRCGSGATVYSAAIPAGAGRGAIVTLACAG